MNDRDACHDRNVNQISDVSHSRDASHNQDDSRSRDASHTKDDSNSRNASHSKDENHSREAGNNRVGRSRGATTAAETDRETVLGLEATGRMPARIKIPNAVLEKLALKISRTPTQQRCQQQQRT
jgi:hypothetical protein